jgi:hypothetical protein
MRPAPQRAKNGKKIALTAFGANVPAASPDAALDFESKPKESERDIFFNHTKQRPKSFHKGEADGADQHGSDPRISALSAFSC